MSYSDRITVNPSRLCALHIFHVFSHKAVESCTPCGDADPELVIFNAHHLLDWQLRLAPENSSHNRSLEVEKRKGRGVVWHTDEGKRRVRDVEDVLIEVVCGTAIRSDDDFLISLFFWQCWTLEVSGKYRYDVMYPVQRIVMSIPWIACPSLSTTMPRVDPFSSTNLSTGPTRLTPGANIPAGRSNWPFRAL